MTAGYPVLLAEYHIEFHGFVKVFVGALILGKVVLVTERLSLGAWVSRRPAWVDIVARTAVYGLGIVVVLLLEKGIEGRAEHGVFGPAVIATLQDTEKHQVWVDTICLTGALLAYNALSVAHRQLGEGGLRRVFCSPLPPDRGCEKETKAS